MIQPQATILLVDDDEAVLEVTEMLLENLGHKVVAKLSSREALTAFQADPHGVYEDLGPHGGCKIMVRAVDLKE